MLLIDKPAGMTSHDVVAAVRRSLAGVRTGHAGTLDPFATGLLLVLLGRATKAQRVLMPLRKRYEVVARLGALSSTGDTEGQITYTGRVPADPPVLPTGQIRQRPPRYSAVKIEGERAYRRARRGEHPRMPERIVTVYRFRELWREPAACAHRGPRAGYEIECAAGGSLCQRRGSAPQGGQLDGCNGGGSDSRSRSFPRDQKYQSNRRRKRSGLLGALPVQSERTVGSARGRIDGAGASADRRLK